MLQYLRIKNLALMEEVALEFEEGFTAVTGETGAGKSVLLGALSILSGARVDKTIIRSGAEACEVEAGLFFSETAALDERLESLELPLCEGGSLILRRIFSKRKMPKIQINGVLTTLANLRAMGEWWIDFHGSGEPQKLFREKWQRRLLDSYARVGEEIREYRELYRGWRELHRQIEELKGEERLSPDEVEFLRKQVEAIDRAELSVEVVEALESDFNRLNHAQELIELASHLESLLAGEEGVAGKLGGALQEGRKLAEIEKGAVGLSDRLESAIIELEDIAEEYSSIVRRGEFDETTARSLEERMNRWLELKRKYGPDVQSVLEARERLAQRVSAQSDVEGTIRKLEREGVELEDKLQRLAEDLRKRRQTAAAGLARKAKELINLLGFKQADFRIVVFREAELKEHGMSSCRFLFLPNAGQELLPLSKIASSGEVARVMLALKTVLAQVDETPVLVFDEVDANIGGEIAGIVGESLSNLGRQHQVFSVTHLPQVASKARNHFVVEKKESADEVAVTIESISEERKKRVVEIARMVGDRSSTSALQHAEELLGICRT